MIYKINIIISLVLFSCSSKTSDERNSEAIALHNSMIQKANHIEHLLSEMKGDTAINKDSIAVLSALLEHWKASLVEVPGNDHDHAAYAHHHSEPLDVTEEQMLEIQKELDERLSTIGKRLSLLKPEPIDNNHEH